MKLVTVGLGYIGLPTSIMFAKHGVDVLGVDIQQDVIDKLNGGQIHIEEPGLQEALDEVIVSGKFKASTSPEKGDVFIIAVPTPNNDDTYKSIDLKYVQSAVENIIPYLEKNNTVIIESTIAPRTTDDFVKPLLEKAGFVIGEDLFLVHCPERVLPGQIMHELVHNNRIIGGVTEACKKAGADVYSRFVQGELIITDAKTAEMSKLMENTYRDVNISLANELVKICTKLEINALNVIEMANKHPRVNLHLPGPGVGGHCLAVDPYFIVAEAPDQAKLIYQARDINVSMPSFIVENVVKSLNGIKDKKITVFGLTYKGNVDDIRESPAMEIYKHLREAGAKEVAAYDPHVKQSWVEQDIKRAVKDSSLILVLTDHNEFKTIELEDIAGMTDKKIFDTKNIVKNYPEEVTYFNLGNLYQFVQ
ncbi:UDP-N-acetyl-D-mannosaminuronic acid dehydrogenase [Metabacillus crassostreae]|uniref:nucleotide sugar dehydrogenase n=1 Tax=Metabacillus crassostreae TaxID=929098 RepID=UPI0019566B04|nr:nucleotide sugar dehydrogenase [Metabacillus crassostreae]MBM7606265.1 UDP-N-acetyl-D-mannosaminuronic acid dehydrogenase [Metabacillus crassostreae]